MNHVIEHQPMDVRDVASILDNLADSTTEPPSFRKVYTKYLTPDCGFKKSYLFRNFFQPRILRVTQNGEMAQCRFENLFLVQTLFLCY